MANQGHDDDGLGLLLVHSSTIVVISDDIIYDNISRCKYSLLVTTSGRKNSSYF